MSQKEINIHILVNSGSGSWSAGCICQRHQGLRNGRTQLSSMKSAWRGSVLLRTFIFLTSSCGTLLSPFKESAVPLSTHSLPEFLESPHYLPCDFPRRTQVLLGFHCPTLWAAGSLPLEGQRRSQEVISTLSLLLLF